MLFSAKGCFLWSFILFIVVLLNPTSIYAQSACSSLTGCTEDITQYNIAYPGIDACTFDRTFYDCSGTTCYQDGNVSCSQTQAVCNNPPSTGDNYNCTKFCTDLSVSPNCGNYPGVDCTTFKNTCLNSYCVAAGGGTNYTCPSPQECVSSGDKAHQCVTPVYTCPAGQAVGGSVYSCQSGSACPSGYTQDTSYSCAASQVCCKKPDCPAGQTIEGLVYSCQSSCSGTGVYTSFTKACTSPNVCCYQSSCPPGGCTTCSATSNPPLKYKCVSGACVSDSCDGTGTETENTCGGKCTPAAPPTTPTTTGTFRCDSIWAQQPQTCASGDCNINLGANYSGTRTSPIQQCWSKDGTSWGCNTDSQTTSHSFPCGQTSIVSMVSRENFNSSTGTAGASSTCPNYSLTPTCGGTPPPPSPGPLVCLKGLGNCNGTGNGSWSNGWTSTAAGQQCGYPDNPTTPNIFDQYRAGGVCYQDGKTPDPPAYAGSQGIVGSYWIKNADGSLTTTPLPYQTNTLFPMFYWIYSPSGSYDAANGLYCGKLTTLNGGKICYQDAYYHSPADQLAYYAVADPYSIGGNNQQLQLYSWPDGYKPTGYYAYQSVKAVESKTDWKCTDTRCFGDESPYNCVNCGGQQCRSADCESDTYDTKWGCKFNDDRGGYGAYTYGALGNFTKGQINDVTNFCAGEPNTPDGGWARVDLIFEKDLSPQACTVSLPTASCSGTTPSLNVSWTGSLNATSYDVYRSTDNGVTYALLTNVTTNSYADSAISQNITYYYKVTAKNTIGSKDCTPAVSAQAVSCDVSIPNVRLDFTFSDSGCYDNTNWPTNFAAPADVASPSTISTVSFILTSSSGTVQTYTTTVPSSGTRNEGIWRPATPIPKPAVGNYTIKATATTQSNITSESNTYNLSVQLSCANPWLKTTGGGIHSDERINLPKP